MTINTKEVYPGLHERLQINNNKELVLTPNDMTTRMKILFC